MTAKVVDGMPVPDVARRQMKTYQSIVDDVMEYVTRAGTIDLSLDADREKLRAVLFAAVQRTGHEMEWAYRRAVDSALNQADGLMSDPKRYLNQRRRRAEQREDFKRRRQEQEKSAAQHRFELVEPEGDPS